MYIKLIQPKMKKRPMDTGLKIRMSPPLGLLTIANMFRNEHRVVIANENIKDIDFDDNPELGLNSYLIQKLGKDAYAMTITLLLNSEGKKMGKTASGAVWLDPEKTAPYDFFQYWRNIADQDVEKVFLLVRSFCRKEFITLQRDVSAVCILTTQLFKQLGEGNVQCRGDFLKAFNRCVLLTAFQLTNICGMATG